MRTLQAASRTIDRAICAYIGHMQRMDARERRLRRARRRDCYLAERWSQRIKDWWAYRKAQQRARW